MRLTARGRAGHGSMVHDDNAVTTIARAVTRLGNHEFPLILSDAVAEVPVRCRRGDRLSFDPDDVRPRSPNWARWPACSAPRATPPTRPCSGPATRPTSSGDRRAVVDCRVLPSRQAAFEREVDELIGPDVTRGGSPELPSCDDDVRRALVDAMNDAVLRPRPGGAHRAPHVLRWDRRESLCAPGDPVLRIRPLRLPPDLDFSALFHGVDERVPSTRCSSGARVLEHFSRTADTARPDEHRRIRDGLDYNPLRLSARAARFTPTSADIRDGQPLKREQVSDHGRRGEDVSPQLSWSGFPAGTRSFAVTIFDWTPPPRRASALGGGESAGHGDRTARRRRGRIAAARRCPDAVQRRRDAPLRRRGSARRPRPSPLLRRRARPRRRQAGPHRGRQPAYLGFNLFMHAIARAVIHGTYEQT